MDDRDNLIIDELYTPPHINLSDEEKEEIRKTLIELGLERDPALYDYIGRFANDN